ncbi:protein of unknown function [Bradyrhizobium vignae]|uniref:Uncharacterized protein n=1 Tax=Bradyrhizobium vignae TaxID=1549949 RepID=A0A2U3Q7Q8_9BRAD|nr:protein of unknown function [Bradyrhizobium vignae]
MTKGEDRAARHSLARKDPEPRVTASAGTNSGKPNGITLACDASTSVRTAEIQNVAIVTSAVAPAIG